MWDNTEGIVGTAELTNHKTWSHYGNFDDAYSEIADITVAPTLFLSWLDPISFSLPYSSITDLTL